MKPQSLRPLALSLLALSALVAVACAQGVAPPECAASQYLNEDKTACVEFTSPFAKASNDLSAELNSGNTAWMLMSSALVMVMTPGVAFFYAGLAGEEMASNTMMMSFVSMALVSIQFFAYGYSNSFAMELFGWAGYKDVTGRAGGVYGIQIPNLVFALFQTQFAMITPALLSGGIVGRMKFGTYVLFVLLWSSLVYIPLARWMWSYKLNDNYELVAMGWEAKMGALDFAGGTVIHISSGFGALVAAIVVGKRYNHGEPVKPHNVPLVMIGLTLLWFGWFGFNAGSATAADGIAAVAAINTHLAASSGFLSWVAVEWFMHKKVDPCGAASGAVAGLVTITPGCGFVYPWAAVIFGICGAVVSFFAVHLKNHLRYDDTLDSFGIHGVAGFLGGMLTGLFATSDVNPATKGGAFYGNANQLWIQFKSQCVAAAYSAAVTFIILMALKYTIGLRVSEEKEIAGVDVSYHGGTAYSSPSLKRANPPTGDFSSLMTPADADKAVNGAVSSQAALLLSVVVATAVALVAGAAAADGSAAVECQPSQYYDPETKSCVDYSSRHEKASADRGVTLDSGNTAWMLMSSALVMIMTPGVAFFYAGLAGEEFASNTMMMSFVSMAIVSIQFFVFGYSVCFGQDLFGWAGYHDVSGAAGGLYGVKIPNAVFALFQTQFAMITPALISGGIVGRMKFGTFIIFTLLWTSIVYDPLVRWIWSYRLDRSFALVPAGWGAKMGTLDFAGGTVIEVASGFSGLVAAVVVGKRYNHGEAVKPHNVPLMMIGTSLIWFGWFGFNAGSAGAADAIAAIAAINTHLAGSAGFLTWMCLEWVLHKKMDPCGSASGAVAGLVCITPSCGYVLPWASLVFGIVGATVSFFAVQLKNYLRYDDTLDVFAIHGLAGFVGGLMTGLFATNKVNPNIKGGAFYGHGAQFLHQLVSFSVAAVYSMVGTFLILMLLKYTVGIRVSEEKEIAGVDLSYHGGTAYTGVSSQNSSRHGGKSSPLFRSANPPDGDFSQLMTPVPEDRAEATRDVEDMA
ncbi:hypothetical protein ATCC90586_006686 [Pythium insidiosum]|nr:hypothetical protein ATCC90586_006686 [Pythium insidiosum]